MKKYKTHSVFSLSGNSLYLNLMTEEEQAAEAPCISRDLRKRAISHVLFLMFTEENWPTKNEDN
jgi:hypothetical protein